MGSKTQTEKSRYPSMYSPGTYITGAQYIVELICEKRAKFDKIELPIKFWNFPEWGGFFRKNLRQVHKLLKRYSERAFIKALRSPEFNNSYSIFTDKFALLIRQEQRKSKLSDIAAGLAYQHQQRNK